MDRVVNGADTDGYARQVTHELNDAAIRAAADQRQRDNHLAQPCLGDHQLEQHFVFRRGRQESVIQCDAGLVLPRVDEFTAYPVPGCQIADCFRSRQRYDPCSQPPEKIQVASAVLAASTRLRV
jgi:hypothetical protein